MKLFLRRFPRVGVLLVIVFCMTRLSRADVVLPGIVSNLVCRYDFDHPVATNAAKETDLGFSGTDINLINGGAAMRTNDGAYPGSALSLQTQQLNPAVNGNDDWKAGIYQTNGLASLSAFSSVTGITIMGWVKPTGTNPNLNSVTVSPSDYYNAVGLMGVLTGNSEGHAVRALLEVIDVSGTLRLVALGRRIDTGNSLTLAATNDWHVLLPNDTWTHVAATFDFDNGTMALYRNGAPLPAAYTTGGDPWSIIGAPEPDVTSSSNPAGIKIGGSFPQNVQERNAFNGRFDDLMFFNRMLSASEVQMQYTNFFSNPAGAPPALGVSQSSGQIVLSWPLLSAEYHLQSSTNLLIDGWIPVADVPATNGETLSVTLSIAEEQQFFRLKKP
jgi:Concanavalin A-like lectin/glucanases superfamily